MVGPKGPDDLPEQVGARRGMGRDEPPEGRPQFHIDIRKAWLLLFSSGITRWSRAPPPMESPSVDSEQPGMIHEEVNVREILGPL